VILGVTDRRTWRARPASLPTATMEQPAREVWLHHSVTPVTKDPYKDMRVIEGVGWDRFGQFPYSYCVHPDGTILEGCGNRRGAHTRNRNGRSFGIALIGNYEERSLTVWQVDAVRWLIGHLIDAGDLKVGVYPTGGHRDVASTACPGANAVRYMDLFRMPWIPEAAVPDNADLPNIEGPLTFHPIATSAGVVLGYYIFSTRTGELHAHGDVPYLGRSEDPTP
jgi:hypothetical protein